MHIFYSPYNGSDQCVLSRDESWHCIKVLRLRKNDEIFLIDGTGGFFKAIIIDDDPKGCTVAIVEKNKDMKVRNYHLHIAICPIKNADRFEWFIEKATEIGIDEITPVITEHSEKFRVNFERLNKLIVSASKQSYNPKFPVLNEIRKFDDIITTDFKGSKFIADYSDKNLKDHYKGGGKLILLVGPEGGFSESETEKASSNDFLKVSLGNTRLRTETAGVVACSMISLLNL